MPFAAPALAAAPAAAPAPSTPAATPLIARLAASLPVVFWRQPILAQAPPSPLPSTGAAGEEQYLHEYDRLHEQIRPILRARGIELLTDPTWGMSLQDALLDEEDVKEWLAFDLDQLGEELLRVPVLPAPLLHPVHAPNTSRA
jgi:hypothetical protein